MLKNKLEPEVVVKCVSPDKDSTIQVDHIYQIGSVSPCGKFVTLLMLTTMGDVIETPSYPASHFEEI